MDETEMKQAEGIFKWLAIAIMWIAVGYAVVNGADPATFVIPAMVTGAMAFFQ